MRLQKFLAQQGVASRRGAEVMIEEGRVEVNGALAELGQKVTPSRDQVTVDGRPLSSRRQPQVVVALNKPKGYLCSHHDPHHKRTIFDLLPAELKALRLVVVGRLDMDSEGLLLLTNDGDLAQRLAHPSNRVVKRYRIELDKPLEARHHKTLLQGIVWEGERLQVEKVVPLEAPGELAARRLEVHLEHGRKREIRRLFYALGYDVKRLLRVQIGSFRLQHLPRGHIRTLTAQEVHALLH